LPRKSLFSAVSDFLIIFFAKTVAQPRIHPHERYDIEDDIRADDEGNSV